MFLLIENLAPAADVVGAFCGSIANPSREVSEPLNGATVISSGRDEEVHECRERS